MGGIKSDDLNAIQKRMQFKVRFCIKLIKTKKIGSKLLFKLQITLNYLIFFTTKLQKKKYYFYFYFKCGFSTKVTCAFLPQEYIIGMI